MFGAFFISSLIINIIYYSNLNKLHKKKINNKLIIYISLICSSVIIATINIFELPSINLIVNIFIFSSISLLYFEHKNYKDYIMDFLNFLFLIIFDGVFYFISESFFLINHNTNNQFLFILSSSLSLIVFNVIFSKVLLKNRIYNIPKQDIMIFFFTCLLHVGVIELLNRGITAFNEYSVKIASLLIAIGIVVADVVLIHYLEHIETAFMIEKENILRKKQIDLTNQYYKIMKEKYLQQRKIVHDFENHIQVIVKAYEGNNKTLAETIVRGIKDEFLSKLLINTSSDILNIIVNDKKSIADKKDIDFEFMIDPSVDLTFISEVDMITIFGNMYDNAIEALEMLDSEKFISTKIYKQNSMLIIVSKNNYNQNLVYRNDKLVSTKKDHSGYGLSNIKMVVDKYSGLFVYGDKNGFFNILIAIPMLNDLNYDKKSI